MIQMVLIWSNPPIRPSKEREMAKETTHRGPERRAARIEIREKKRAETVLRKKLVKERKNRPLEEM